MGTDPGQLSFGIAQLQAASSQTNPTFDTLTVTGDSVLADALIGGDATLSGAVAMDLPEEAPEGDNLLWSNNDVVTTTGPGA